jgi:putative transposon-encoded protein
MNQTKNTLTIENPKKLYMKRVKKLANGAYVGVPKELIGKHLYIIVPHEDKVEE